MVAVAEVDAGTFASWLGGAGCRLRWGAPFCVSFAIASCVAWGLKRKVRLLGSYIPVLG